MVIEKFIINKLLRWKFVTDYPAISKSVIIFAPHTSYWDAIIGKLLLRSKGIKHKLLIKKELFYFPMNVVMWLFGAIPVGGVKGHNAIHDAVAILNTSDNLNLVICPEGQLAPTDRWNPGFYYMAEKAGAPIVVAYLDYAKRESGVKGVIDELTTINDIYRQLAEMYDGVTACHPESFLLPKYKRIGP